MFDERRKRRALRKKIASLKEQEAISRALTDRRSPKFDPEARTAVHGYLISQLEDRLADLETDQLVRKARKLGLEIPHKEGWWREDEGYVGEMISKGVYEGKFYLTEFGKVGVSKLIREERRKSIEWWVKIITPILGALISLLGLIVALISVSRK